VPSLAASARIATTALICFTAPARRFGAPRLQLFPDEAETSPSPDTPELNVTKESLVGFWQVFDDQASEDAINSMATGGSPAALFSSTIVLRADGQTSRGSDFPGGTWSLREVASADGGTRKRLAIELRSRLRRQEWRYDGLLIGLQQSEPPVPEMDSSSESTPASAAPQIELRVVGTAARWDTTDEEAPAAMGKPAAFSMRRIEVDRRKLVPTIKPFSAPIDPEAVKLEQEWRRVRQQSEEDAIRQVLTDVRAAKAEHGDEWMNEMRVREGVDYWREGEEPDEMPDSSTK